MATYTTNYNLEKPEASDDFGDFRESYNSNMDIIDQNLGGGGGGGGGHTIVDPDGTTMPNRSKLKFTGSVSVTDDSANNQTVVNITGGGGGGGEYYLNDGLIGSSGGTYITCNLDKTLVNGYYLVVVDDAGSRTYTYMEWNGTTQTLTIGANWQLQITSTTAGLTYYSGAWRNIYCDILSLGGSGGGSGDTVTWNQIQATGEKIAEITINGTTTDVLIPFEAKIIVTTTTGLTVTATKGGTTYTATETSTGFYEVTIDSKGTWTVTDGTNTTTVSVTAQTTYNVAFMVIPDGSTVTPTDDIQTWLNCANIWDKAYTTLAEVLADSTTLSALISSNNAVDYLVRSTSWAGISLVPTMTDNTHPSGECIGSGVQESYPAWKAFDKDTSTFSVTLSVTDYLGYMFETPQCVCGLHFTNRGGGYHTWASTIKVQGTNDGITFTDVSPTLNNTESSGATTNFTFTNSTKYKGYVVKGITSSVSAYFNAAEIQFISENLCADSTAMTYIGLNNYCANKLLADATWRTAICNSTYFESVLNVKVPTMTGDDSRILYSTYSPSNLPYYAFNGLGGDSNWASNVTYYGYQDAHPWLGFDFTRNVKIVRVDVTKNSNDPNFYVDYKVQHSDDVNGTWNDIYSGNSGGASFSVIMPTYTQDACWRVYSVTEKTSNQYVRVVEMQFYGREDV